MNRTHLSLIPKLLVSLGVIASGSWVGIVKSAQAQCRNCTSAPAPECGGSFGHHYHGGIGTFFGIVSDIGYYCHNGASCSEDVPCWPEFRSTSRLRRVASMGDANTILATAAELRLQVRLGDRHLAILDCDRTAIMHQIPISGDLERALRRRLGERDTFSYLYAVLEGGSLRGAMSLGESDKSMLSLGGVL